MSKQDKLVSVLIQFIENFKADFEAEKYRVFGLLYADYIIRNEIKITKLLREAKHPQKYVSEISKGLHLKKYVTIKSDVLKKHYINP